MGELVFIGLGLWGNKDMTLAGLKEARSCEKIFAEFYTSMLEAPIKKIEKMIGKPIVLLERENVENGKIILDEASKKKVCLLTGGDPMTATTHIDLRLRAMERGISTKVVHGISIMTAAAGLLGLQTYKFGRTTTLAFPEQNYFPCSPYEVIGENMKRGLHTLVLLDITKEGYMTANEGIRLLIEMERRMKGGVIGEKTLMTVVARASSPSPTIMAGYPDRLIKMDFGPPLHCIVIPGKLHFMEAKALVMLAKAPEEILE
ncbi:MAG: diphthine synthase [Candidatus Thermoplasmatota archaeon]|nr:diphthine synthase [Candidatus Thermoplasmatota archaeon]